MEMKSAQNGRNHFDVSGNESTTAIMEINPPLETSLHKFMSDELRWYFEFLVMVLLAGIFSLFGITTNIINMIVFVHQGFKESITVSLFSLAVSDLLGVVTLLWCSVSYGVIMLGLSELTFDPVSVWYITAMYPHVIINKVSNWITALISLERCVCVVSPFKVKKWFTPKRTVLIVMGICLLVSIGYLPIYITYNLSPVLDAERNMTIISLRLVGNRFLTEDISNSLNDLILPSVNLLLVLVFTAVLMVTIRKSSQWRKSTSSSGKTTTSVGGENSSGSSASRRANKKETLPSSNKEVSAMKMCLVITLIFLVCTIPANAMCLIVIIDKRWEYWGQYRNIYLTCYAFIFILESLNAGINIFVYYKMSSKYKIVFTQIFGNEHPV